MKLVHVKSTDMTNIKIIPDLHLPEIQGFKLPNAPELPSGKSIIRFVTDNLSTNKLSNSKVIIQENNSLKHRSLTAGEISMCRKFFQNSIDYRRVKIINKAILPKQDVPITPHGNPYYPDGLIGSNIYQDDFSNPKFKDNPIRTNGTDLRIKAKLTFIHEMTHVWQHQKGLDLIKRGVLLQSLDRITPDNLYDAYSYQLKYDSKFNDFNFEQQATIIADYFGIISGFNEINFSRYWIKYSNPFWKQYINDLMFPIINNPKDFKIKGVTLDNPITTAVATFYYIVK